MKTAFLSALAAVVFAAQAAAQEIVTRKVSFTSDGEIMAGVTLVSLPMIIAYFIFQRWIVRGIAATGLAN